jgi:hypothetical protein
MPLLKSKSGTAKVQDVVFLAKFSSLPPRPLRPLREAFIFVWLRLRRAM